MSLSFTRSFLNKFVLNIKCNNVQQKRLRSIRAALLKDKESNKVLEIDQISEVKQLDKTQVRIQVHYCSLNKHDIDLFKTNTKKNFVPGYEFSGEVLEVGSDVKADVITVGEEVAVLSKNRGGFAEECVVDAIDVWRLPTKIKRKDAAVLIFGHSNALYAFSRMTEVKENTKVLITAGAGGLGLAAVDIAAHIYKAKPVGISQSEDMLALIRERGAFKTSTFKNKNLTKEFAGMDIIYDAVGGDYHKLIAECIKPEGKILYAGPHPDTLHSPPLNSSFIVVNIEGLRTTNPELYRSIVNDTLDVADQGMISAFVSAEYKLEEIDKAVKFIEDKKCLGKVLINVAAD